MVTEHEVQGATLMMFLGALGIGATAFATMSASNPTPYAPFSLTVVGPYFDMGIAAVAIWPIVFLLWGLPLFGRTRQIPAWSATLAAVCWCSGLIWLGVRARAGVTHQGLSHVIILGLANVAVGSVLYWLFRRDKVAPSFAGNFVFHWLVVAWISWGATPWLGEGI